MQISNGVLRSVGGMGREVVHEEADLAVAVLLPQLREVLLELEDVHRLWE